MRFSEKQIQVLKTVFSITGKLRPTSSIRKTAPEFSSHSEELQRAVDFGGKKQDLLSVFFILAERIHLPENSPGKLKYSIGIGIKNADRHLHVSNDDRSKIFIELEKPDKNGWVKVSSESDKDFDTYMQEAEKEYFTKEKNGGLFSVFFVAGLAFFGVSLARRGFYPRRNSRK